MGQEILNSVVRKKSWKIKAFARLYPKCSEVSLKGSKTEKNVKTRSRLKRKAIQNDSV